MAVETPESFAQSRSMSSTEIGTLTLCAGIASSLVLDRDRDKPDLSRRRGRPQNRPDARVQQLAPAHFGEGKQ